MRIHHEQIGESGFGRVVVCHDPSKMLTPPPDLPFIEIDAGANTPLYYDVLLKPRKYLVSAAGELFVDEDFVPEEWVNP